jgi:hypothetical protein
MDPNSIMDIFLLLLALVIAWILLRFILRLTMKIFSCGCSLIVLLGILLLILRLSGILQTS